MKDAWRPLNCEFRAREVVRVGMGEALSQCGTADSLVLPQTVGWGWVLSWASPSAPSSSGRSSLPCSGTSTRTPVSIQHPGDPRGGMGGPPACPLLGCPFFPPGQSPHMSQRPGCSIAFICTVL